MSLNKEFSSLTDRTERHQWITEKFTGLGVEVYTQNFTVNRPLVGDKVRASILKLGQFSVE